MLPPAAVEVRPEGCYPAARVDVAGRTFPAVVGRDGVAPEGTKTEGDGRTPAGVFPLREIFYRDDRVPRPASALPVRAIGPDDVWCDDPASPAYNTLIREAGSTSDERLHRADHLYDLVVVIGYNDDPAVPGKGSAVFLHVTREQRLPLSSATAGCVALRRGDLQELVSLLPADAMVRIFEDTSAGRRLIDLPP